MTPRVRSNREEEEGGVRAPGASPWHPSAIRGEVPMSLTLRHGGQIRTKLRFEIIGHHDRPLLIVAGGVSAGRHVLSSNEFPEAAWWDVQRDAFPLQDYRVLAIDWLGADGAIDLPIDPADQAAAIAFLLGDLAIADVAAFIGASYGAMTGMHFAARYPDRLGALLAISAASRSHPFSSACRSLQRQALALGESAASPEAGIALARAMAMLTYRTPEEFAERFTQAPTIASDGRLRVGADQYLASHGARHCQRMSATAYRRLSESIDLHRIEPSDIHVPLTIAAVDRDALVPKADIEALARAVPGTRLHVIRSLYGHDAFLKEVRQVAAIIAQFLSSLEHSQ